VPGGPVIGHLGLFVELGSHPVADELANDAVAVLLGVFLNGMADIAQAVAGLHLRDAEHQALLVTVIRRLASALTLPIGNVTAESET